MNTLILGILHDIILFIPVVIRALVLYNKKNDYIPFCYQVAIIIYGGLTIYHAFKSIYLLLRNKKSENFHSSLIWLGFCLIFLIDAIVNILFDF